LKVDCKERIRKKKFLHFFSEMGKKHKEPETPSKKRKSAPSKSTSEGKSKKKKAKIEVKQDESNTLLTLKELTERTGLSESMLVVAMELLDKSSPLTLIDIVCPNDKIRSLNEEVIEAHRAEFMEKKSLKTHKDDDIRKFIVEKAERKLHNTKIKVAGSTQQEKMDPTLKDKTMVDDFLGYAQTSRGYFVYVYFIGPSSRASELRNLKNWIPVHKSHLTYFHKRIRDHKPYHRHTKFDQTPYKESVTPAYDPRFIMDTWLRKAGNEYKPLLRAHKSLIEKETDFVVKHFEESDKVSTLHYYDESKPDVLMLDLTMDDVIKEEDKKPTTATRFNVAEDRLRQADAGFRYTDKELCHVTIEEFPSLSRIPLPPEIDITWEEFAHIASRVYVHEKNPFPPDYYQCDPLQMVKPALMALNLEMQVRRIAAMLGDEKLQILEADNMKPILDFMGKDPGCREEIKRATFNCLLAFMAVELMTREEPEKIKEIFAQRNGEASFKPLDY